MVIERCQDLMDDTGAINFFARRCVLCGDLIDPVIQQNRVNPIVPCHRKKMRVRRPSPQAMHMFRKTQGALPAEESPWG